MQPKAAAPAELYLDKMRHYQNLLVALEGVQKATQSLAQGYSAEFIVADLEASITAIGQLTGAISSQQVLDHIFAQFCIGK